jgi:hypothetical protein
MIEQNRHKIDVVAIRLPFDKVSECRGVKRCCNPRLVVADLGSNDTWKNDINSAWLRMGNVADSCDFVLSGNGVDVVLDKLEFEFTPNSYYASIIWKDILTSTGSGLYTLNINYNISGITGTIEWAEYNLLPYSYNVVKDTIRLKAQFDHFQQIEGINFKGSGVIDTIRLNGYFGDKQPNTEIDNIIYENREMKSVIRENIGIYDLKTDPISEDVMSILVDLYLLSEVNLWVSDWNAYNHTYFLNDTNVIVKESPEINYTDSRLASLTCKVEDKFKTNRTYYGE